MKRIAIALFSFCLASGATATFAADKGSMPAAMAKDSMAKDSMAKDSKAKDSKAKDSMAKDSMAKDSMAAQSPPKSKRKSKDKTKSGMAHDAAKDKAAPGM